MDKITLDAFKRLCDVYREHENINLDDNAAWDHVCECVRQIVVDSADADDTEFISELGLSVLSSLERLAVKNGR